MSRPDAGPGAVPPAGGGSDTEATHATVDAGARTLPRAEPLPHGPAPPAAATQPPAAQPVAPPPDGGSPAQTTPPTTHTVQRDAGAARADAGGSASDATLAPAHAGAAAETVSAASGARVPRRLGPYRLLRELGHGGMGVVFHALHEQLGTVCAVKVLIAGEHASAEAIARFRREAAAVARMGKHPHIVTVHDLGEDAGITYYAMELVEGDSLGHHLQARGVDPAGSAVLAEKVARALHFAHQHGVIHRDLKPANIVVRADGEPQVMDFGLAHELSSGEHLTVTGDVMGSPNYMAPEQVRGCLAAIDARTDVYGLGGILYEMLTGVPPHPGHQLPQVFAAIVAGQTIAPRQVNPAVPRDLETICLKCLEPEPARRYPTAVALADDLARWRAGEPISARPTTWAYRAWKRVRRNPVQSALAAGLFLAAVAAAGGAWWAWQRDRAAEQARRDLIDRSLEELARSGRALVEAALARRALGDLAGSREFAAELEEPVRKLSDLDPTLAEPWFHLGRLRRAQLRAEEAERAQDRAVELARVPDASAGSRKVLAGALYERGVLRSLRYQKLAEELRQREVQQAALVAGPDAPPPPVPTAAELLARAPELRRVRDGAIADLDEVARAPAGAAAAAAGPGAGAAAGLAARGLLASLRGEPRRAVEPHLTAALAADRYMPEVYTAAAALAAAELDWEAAAGWLERGHEVDRGYFPHLLQLAQLLLAAAGATEAHGGNGGPLRARAFQATEVWRAADPGQAEAWSVQSAVRLAEAAARRQAGQDPEAACQAALAAAAEALARDPRSGRALETRAAAHALQGRWRQDCGEDPAVLYTQSLAEYAALLATDAGAGARDSITQRSVINRWFGEWCVTHGRDPSPAWQAALAELARAQALAPRDLAVARDQCAIHQLFGDWRASMDMEPSEAYDQALAALRRALELDPRDAPALSLRGAVLCARTDWLGRQGKDVAPLLGEALAAWEEALAVNPRLWEALAARAGAFRLLGRLDRQQGKDPTEWYGKALATARAALAANPRCSQAAYLEARVHEDEGDWQRSRGEDPAGAWQRAVAADEHALALNPRFAAAAAHLAWVRTLQADLRRGRGEDIGALVEQALAGFASALRLNPSLWEAARDRGLLLESVGRNREAVAAYEEALRIRPLRADLAVHLARATGKVKGGAAAGGPAWRRALEQARERMAAGDYRAAGEAYAEALAKYGVETNALPEAERRTREESAELRALFRDAHFDLARINAQASVGRAGPGLPGTPPAAAGAEQQRMLAFANLRRALALGWSDAARLAAEADLAPLRDDPRWADLMRRAGGGK